MVPNGWNKTYLKNIISGSIKNGYSPLPAANKTGYWVMSLGALTDNGINAKEIKPVDLDEKVKQSLLTNGDFLISRSNTPDKVGRSIRFKGEIENCSYPDLMMKFRVDPEKADPDFVEFKLSSSEIRQYYKSCAAGSSSTMVKINKSTVENTPLLLPSLSEQKKIAQILSSWDKAITTTKQLLANSLTQKKALTQQLLTGQKRLQDNNGFRFSGEWKHHRLESLCTIKTGKKDVNEGNQEGNYPFFTCASEPTRSDNYSYDCEALLIAGNGMLGKTHYFYGKFEAYQRTYILSEFNGLDVPYLHQYILYWLIRDIDREKQHGAMPYIKLGLLQNFKVLLPCIEEQQKIAAVLSSADQEITAMQQKLHVLKQEKKALMQQLFTGKRRVQIN